MKPLVGIVTSNPQAIKRAQILVDNLAAELLSFPTAEKIEESGKGEDISLIIIHAAQGMDEQTMSAQVQVARYHSPKALMMVILHNRPSSDTVAFTKKSGAEAILSDQEYESTSLPEFLSSLKLNWEYIPIKAAELAKNKPVPITIYHLMPLNFKLVPMMKPGTVLTPEKSEKMKTIGEFYISRDDVDAYQEYIDKNQDLSANGLLSRCRAKYMSLNMGYKRLVQVLTDQSKFSSFQEGKELLDRVYALAGDLIASLSSVGDSWEVINNSSLKDLTPIDRAPAVASVSGLMSLMTGIGKPEEVMVAALLADIGMLNLHPHTLQKIKAHGIAALVGEEKKEYEQHPLVSVNRLLARRIPLPENLKNIILTTHERADRQGFPNQPQKPHPHEAQLIQFAEKIDNDTKLEFGKQRRNPADVRDELYKMEFDGGTYYTDFMVKIKPVCLKPSK